MRTRIDVHSRSTRRLTGGSGRVTPISNEGCRRRLHKKSQPTTTHYSCSTYCKCRRLRDVPEPWVVEILACQSPRLIMHWPHACIKWDSGTKLFALPSKARRLNAAWKSIRKESGTISIRDGQVPVPVPVPVSRWFRSRFRSRARS